LIVFNYAPHGFMAEKGKLKKFLKKVHDICLQFVGIIFVSNAYTAWKDRN